MPFVNPNAQKSRIRCFNCGALSLQEWCINDWDVVKAPEHTGMKVWFSKQKYTGNAWCPRCQRPRGYGPGGANAWTDAQIEEAMANHWGPPQMDAAGPAGQHAAAGAFGACAAAPPAPAPAAVTAADLELVRAEVREQRAEVDELRRRLAALTVAVQGGGWGTWGRGWGEPDAGEWGEAVPGKPADAQGP